MHNLIISLFIVIATASRQSVTLEDGSNDRSCPFIQCARLELLCGGVYTADLFFKYKDGLTSINAPYRVFYQIQDGLYFLMVCFNDSPLQRCNSTILLNDDLKFFCGDVKIPLGLPGSQIFCHKNIMNYVNDLLCECTKPRLPRFLIWQWEGEAAIHYASKSEELPTELVSSAGRSSGGALLPCLVGALLQK
ncbi:uncharacterized protein LOC108054058 [Drosophila rhopaloa]|uniref:Uncharacterized protein n=1 Tax=Drosophila rhopaloa TaxID=1041015 RepID=A0ABM5I8Z1_DRORH|nr:uncharacterized protein LOC108054058 [Drosophila rhopaloa]